MPSGSVPLTVFTLMLKSPNVFRNLGLLESILSGNAALVYLFIVVSKLASFRRRNMVSDGRPLASAPRGSSLKELQKMASMLGGYP